MPLFVVETRRVNVAHNQCADDGATTAGGGEESSRRRFWTARSPWLRSTTTRGSMLGSPSSSLQSYCSLGASGEEGGKL